jgi:hypothetical protein
MTTMDPDNPALNADGSLKNAEDIEWEYSPTQPSRILPSPEPSGAIVNAAKLKPMAPIFQFGTQLGPEHFATPKPLKRKHAGVASIVESAHGSKGPEMWKEKTHAMTMSKVAAPKSTKAVNCLKSNNTFLHGNRSLASSPSATAASSLADSGDDEAETQTKKKRKWGDGPVDVLTVFKQVEGDDIGGGYECKICM